jgi:phosphatidylethanolamine/phosphatidyl-N-methylethanolamine N-methyltransferase
VKMFYSDFYTTVFNESGFTKFSFQMTHKLLEKNYHFHSRKMNRFREKNFRIIEIGAGKGEHLPFVKDDFSEYLMLDLFDPPENYFGLENSRVKWIKADICGQLKDYGLFDRVIVMCVLHHLEDIESAVENMMRILKPGGAITIFLPSDPGLFNRLNRRIFVTSKAKKHGFFNYDLVNALEHRNHCYSIDKQLKYLFKDFNVSRKFYPINLPFYDFTLFSIWNITKN